MEGTLRSICEWKKVEIAELSVQAVVSIPPRTSVAELMGVLKGKSAIRLFTSYPRMKSRPYWGGTISGHEGIA